ncbi:MAG: hypothetical protein K9M44_02805 [Candidatus Pacebacteria bacterium]|nr:hypothetical protein [Candidatus Paceibacterota bacterium]
MKKHQKQSELQLLEIDRKILEIENNSDFIVPIFKLGYDDIPIDRQIPKQQKAVYTVIVRLQEEIFKLKQALVQGRIDQFEFLLAVSSLELHLDALRSTFWLSLQPFFEGWLRPGWNQLTIKENFSLCISFSPSNFKGEKKVINLSLPD